MKILSINAGSSSLKFCLFEMPEEKEIASGTFEKIGIPNSLYGIKYNGEKIKKERDMKDHTEAVNILLEEFKNLNIISSFDEIEGIGHRVVHGGSKYIDSVLIDESVIETTKELIPLAPLHNPANITGIKSCTEVLPNVKQVAVYDTAFHQTMKASEFLYPIPYEWYTEYGIRKYGFHGTSHKYVSEYMTEKLGRNPKMINCHIGNGASICAIKDGKSIDTSMGFTPICGVMMGTRSGDIDPGLMPYIMDRTADTVDEIINKLNKQSGVLAISGVSSDMRDVEEAYLRKEERSILAIDMYVKKIVNYISMYNTLLEGAEVITFTAGVGENSDTIRKLVCDKLKFLGVEIDEEKNSGLRGIFEKISKDTSTMELYVVPTNEELMIARDTYELVS